MTRRTNAILWFSAVAGALCSNLEAWDDHAKDPDPPVGAPLAGFSTLCQEPDQNSHAGFVFIHSDTAFGSRAAERFVSPSVARLTRVAWWGTYVLPNALVECAPTTDDFTLTVYTNAGGIPGEVLSANEFGAGANRFTTGETVVMFGIGFTEYGFAVQLQEPFTTDAGAAYWVEIVRGSFAVDGCTWWWETAPPGTIGDGSALWDQGHGDGYETVDFDLAMCVQLRLDCNRNGIADDLDILDGNSSDCNGTAIPDECEAIGDYDGDANVDLDDYGQWDPCMTGSDAGPYTPGCESFDLDTDGDVDLLDFAGFQVLFGCP